MARSEDAALLDSWQLSLHDKAPRTVQLYRQVLDLFTAWLVDTDRPPLHEVARRDAARPTCSPTTSCGNCSKPARVAGSTSAAITPRSAPWPDRAASVGAHRVAHRRRRPHVADHRRAPRQGRPDALRADRPHDGSRDRPNKRVRARHRFADLPQLWIGHRGAASRKGLGPILEKRAEQAGIGHVHPHQLRHTWAHRFLCLGGQEGDLQRLGGWENADVMRRYGSAMAAPPIPGDARNVRVRGDVLVFDIGIPGTDVWERKLDRTFAGPPNQCFRLTGTTLNTGISVQDNCF